jgi:hypothetical protein
VRRHGGGVRARVSRDAPRAKTVATRAETTRRTGARFDYDFCFFFEKVMTRGNTTDARARASSRAGTDATPRR